MNLTARVLATASGVAMVAVAGTGAHGVARDAAASAVLAVLVAVLSRPVATLAVLLTMTAIALSSPQPVLVAVSGLFAAVYLVLRHATGLSSVSGATMVSAVGFTLVGLVATAFPLQVPWLPLLAPLAVFAVYLLATRPFLRDEDG
jgi:hypothetical protein